MTSVSSETIYFRMSKESPPVGVTVRVGKKYSYSTRDGNGNGVGVITSIELSRYGDKMVLTFDSGDVITDMQVGYISQVPDLDDEQLAEVRELVHKISIFCNRSGVGISKREMRELLEMLDIPLRNPCNHWA